MGIVRGLQNDIFISYAAVNNEDVTYDGPLLDAHGGARNGWVDVFTRELSAKLRGMRLSPTVWYDKSNILRGECYSDILVGAARTSAIVVALVSKAYLTRPWCKEELAAFFSQDESLWPFKVNDFCRLVIVSLENLSDRDTTAALSRSTTPPGADPRDYLRLPSEFYVSRAGACYRLRNEPADDTRQAYEEKLTALAAELHGILEVMSQDAPAAPEIMARSRFWHPDKQCVYVCNVRDTILQPGEPSRVGDQTSNSPSVVERLSAGLEQEKINVLDPGVAGPASVEDYLEVTSRGLERADLCVHLIDIEMANQFAPSVFSVLQKTAQRAVEEAERDQRQDRPLKRLIWISNQTWDGRERLPEEQKRFVSNLNDQANPPAGVTVLRSDGRTLLETIRSQLGLIQQNRTRQLPPARTSAYISFQQKNRGNADRITNLLQNSFKILAIPYITTCSAPSKMLNLHRVYIRSCDRLVVIYSGEDDDDLLFLHQKYIAIVNELRDRNLVKFQRAVIYEPPPPPAIHAPPGVIDESWQIVERGNDARLIQVVTAA